MGPTAGIPGTPARAELIALKKKIRLAEDGHRFLKQKRDVQVLELRDMVHRLMVASRELKDLHQRADESVTIAGMMEGALGIEVVAVAVEGNPEFYVHYRNSMGVRLPVYTPVNTKKELVKRGYGLPGTSSVIDETAERYEELVEAVIRTAEIRSGILRILSDVEQTKRRVNALEKLVIPALVSRRDRIAAVHDELEREEFSRLFWMKKKAGRYRSVENP
jgi:V/A-type H+-transporting ATPase subunit D